MEYRRATLRLAGAGKEEAAIDMRLETDGPGAQKGTGEAHVTVKGSLTSHNGGQLHTGGSCVE